MKKNIERITARIAQAARQCGRNPDTIRLVAVSKTKPVEMVRAAIDAGAKIIGENYVQEAREKYHALGAHPVSWHFIGHLQSNKAKYVVRMFDLIHSVDSVKLARELDKQARNIDKIQNILIQVNIAQEAAKSGASAGDTRQLIEAIAPLSHVRIKGLMTLPPFFNDPLQARPYFKALRQLRDDIRGHDIPNVSLDELSMGMTGDFEVAIAEGATLVRIGTALFGRRD